MTSRERFRETMSYGAPDRVPYFEEGIRKDVLRAWRAQGLAGDADLATMFPCDYRERMEVDLEPLAVEARDEFHLRIRLANATPTMDPPATAARQPPAGRRPVCRECNAVASAISRTRGVKSEGAP